MGGHLGPFWGAFGVHKGCTGTDSREWDGACPQAGRVSQAKLLGGAPQQPPGPDCSSGVRVFWLLQFWCTSTDLGVFAGRSST